MKLLRTVQQTSRHILRNPNVYKDSDSIFNCQNDYQSNTVKILEDPANDRKLILVGTLNCSDFLAKRTEMLLKDLQPDSVLVQTTPNWFDHLNSLSSNIQTNLDLMELQKGKIFEQLWAPKNFRGKIFLMRFYSWCLLMRSIINVHFDEKSPFLPGLEVYNAIKYAKDNKKDIIYADKFFGTTTINGLKIEKRMNIFDVFFKRNIFNNQVKQWNIEYRDMMNMIALTGIENFQESIDYQKINFINSYLERIIPHQKKILIDKADIRIFKSIYSKMPGKTLFALVNYWNMPGIEGHWRHSTQTEEVKEFIHPIGDMDIDSMSEVDLIGEHLRRKTATISKTEPGLTCNYITQYHKMTTEPERDRHAFFDSYKDPELEHSLYNNENEGVEDLPYKLGHHQFNLIQ